jgi:hypothetical protein
MENFSENHTIVLDEVRDKTDKLLYHVEGLMSAYELTGEHRVAEHLNKIIWYLINITQFIDKAICPDEEV